MVGQTETIKLDDHRYMVELPLEVLPRRRPRHG
jgi:hypothetical protein